VRGESETLRGDTRVKAIKMTVTGKKGRQFFRGKINTVDGDTVEVIEVDD